MTTKTKAIIALLVTGLSYVLLSVAIRLLGSGLSPFTQTTARIFIALIIAVVIFNKEIRISEFKKIKSKDWIILTLMGSLGYAVAVYFMTLGALQSTLLNIAVILATSPFFVFLISVLFFKKKFNVKLGLLVVTSILGVAMISSGSIIPRLDGFGTGEMYLIMATAAFAVYYVLRPKLSKEITNRQITLITIFIAFLFSLVPLILSRESIDMQNVVQPAVLIGLLIGGIANILTTQLVNYAFEHIDPVIGSQVLLSENIFALVIGFIFYNEGLTLPGLIGAIIVIVSVYLSNKIQS